MALAVLETLNDAQNQKSPRLTRRNAVRWFFPAVSGLLLAGVLIGFAPTFYLRSLFRYSPMPIYLYVHGALLTTWFVLVFAQTSLVATHRTDRHRRLGVVTVLVAALVVPMSAFVVVNAARRAQGPITALLQLAVVGDLLSLVWFVGFVAAGVYFRRRPDVHKRRMMAACFTIYGPVFARFELVYKLPVPPPAVIPLAVVTLGAYDLIVNRRLHRATLWIAVLLVGGLLPVLGLLIASGAASAIIDALR